MNIGSKNPIKIKAVQECFPDWEIEAVVAGSGIKEQPMSLQEIIEGSQNRAQMWEGWGIGIESGIMQVERASSGWVNTIACSIWDADRRKFALGLASGFVVPIAIIDIVLDEGVELGEAARRVGLTTEQRIGYGEGIVNILTDGKMARKPYIKQAIEMAMIQVNHPELF